VDRLLVAPPRGGARHPRSWPSCGGVGPQPRSRADAGVLAEFLRSTTAPENRCDVEDNAGRLATGSRDGMQTVAADSGWNGGAQWLHGVLSGGGRARTADDAGNSALLLAQLRDVADERRSAAYVSACALVSGSDEVVVRGRMAGAIAREPAAMRLRYDPVFLGDGEDRTAARCLRRKRTRNRLRGRALALLLPVYAAGS